MSKYHKGELLSPKCTDDMTEAEWLACRAHGPSGDRDFTIGGSDLAAALGVSPYKSKREFWDEKMGIKPKVERSLPQDVFDKGHRFEAPIAMGLLDDLEEIYGKGNVIVEFDKYIYGCADRYPNGDLRYPYMVINYDCNIKIRINGTWRFFLGEIKTLDEHAYSTQKDWLNGIVPIQYDYQCRYYMKALDVDGIIICCAWGLSKAKRKHILIQRDPVIEKDMMDAADDFYWSLKAGIPPVAVEDSSKKQLLEYYGRKYALSSKEISVQFEIPESYKEVIKKIQEIDKKLVQNEIQKDRLEEKRDELLCEIFPLFEKNTDGYIEMDDQYRIYLERKDHFTRQSFDTEKFKQEEPTLFNEFQESVLNAKELKKKHPAIAGKYVIPPAPTGKTDFKASLYDKQKKVTVTTVKTVSGRWEQRKKKGAKA